MLLFPEIIFNENFKKANAMRELSSSRHLTFHFKNLFAESGSVSNR